MPSNPTHRPARARILAALCSALLVSGCFLPFRGLYPETDLAAELWPDLAPLSPPEIAVRLDHKVSLAAPVAAAALWLDNGSKEPKRYAVGEEILPEYQRAPLFAEFCESLSQPPLGMVTALPAPHFERGNHPDPTSLELAHRAAARVQADIAVVLRTRTHEKTIRNFLSPLYLLIVTQRFVPGDDFAVFATAEACAFHVRSGVLLACSHGYGRAENRFAVPWGPEEAFAQLRRTALKRALQPTAKPLLDTIFVRTQTDEATALLR